MCIAPGIVSEEICISYWPDAQHNTW